MASSPPTSTVMVAEDALWAPPVTGASSVTTPSVCSRWARRSSSCRSFVLMSIHVPPVRNPSTSPRSPSTTATMAFTDGRQVITDSHARATSAGDSAQCAPRAMRSAAAERSRSCTVTSNPAASKFAARCPPMLPIPMQPMFMAVHATRGLHQHRHLTLRSEAPLLCLSVEGVDPGADGFGFVATDSVGASRRVLPTLSLRSM